MKQSTATLMMGCSLVALWAALVGPLRAAQQSATAQPPALGSTATLDDLTGPQSQPAQKRTGRSLIVQPAAEPQPALKHRFWPARLELRPGRAELHFYRAILMWRSYPEDKRREIDVVDGAALTDSQQVMVDAQGNVFEELQALALSEDQTWDLRWPDTTGAGVYMYLLPDVQEARSLALLLRLRIRQRLARGDFEGAIDDLQTGFRLAAFTGQGEILVQSLVGVAIGGIMYDEVERALQIPGCPNLYWALASLPRPLVKVQAAVQVEGEMIFRVFPILQDAESRQLSAEAWSQAWRAALDDLKLIGAAENKSDFDVFAIGVLGGLYATEARRRLQEAGWDEQQLAATPIERLLAIDTARELRIWRDALFKASLLPRREAAAVAARNQQAFSQWAGANRLSSAAAVVAGLLFPAIQGALSAQTRGELMLNRLMTIEALRMHAASHEGHLPAALEQLDPVPALEDPYASAAFGYQVENVGDSQVVTLTCDPRASFDEILSTRISFPASR